MLIHPRQGERVLWLSGLAWLLACPSPRLLGQAPAPALAALWSFDEADPAVVHDSSGRGNDGTSSGQVPRVAGVTNSAGLFAGSQLVRCAAAQIRTDGPFTVCFWCKPGSQAKAGLLARHALLGPGATWSVWLDESNKVCFSLADQTARSDVSLGLGVWSHVVAVYDPVVGSPYPADPRRSLRVYLNGALRGLLEPNVPPAASVDPGADLSIGGPPSVSLQGELPFFSGEFDEVIIWEGVLGAPAIAAASGWRSTWTRGYYHTLYNGIPVPKGFQPRAPFGTFWHNDQAELPPYLSDPPDLIDIDLGRQLFVDDFLVASTDLRRVWHDPIPYRGNPVLTYDRPWEFDRRYGPFAAPFSDGVWFDPQFGKYVLYYMAGTFRFTARAVSDDGLVWEKPVLDVIPGSNIVYPPNVNPAYTLQQVLDEDPYGLTRDSATVWLDLSAATPGRRYRMLVTRAHSNNGQSHPDDIALFDSADGIRWTGPTVVNSGNESNDRTTFYHNPFRGVWTFSVRRAWPPTGGWRTRLYWEVPGDPAAGPFWESAFGSPWDYPLWTMSDGLDQPYPGVPPRDPELYNLDATAYESLLVGYHSILRGLRDNPPGRPKLNEVFLGFSRDGYTWSRSPQRSRGFLADSDDPGAWNYGNVQSVGGGLLVVGDWLYLYSSGRQGVRLPDSPHTDGSGSTGAAFLRRDGFASLEAGLEGGTLQTRAVVFHHGDRLAINADIRLGGSLRAEITRGDGTTIPGFSLADCPVVRGNNTRHVVQFRGGNLAALQGSPIRLRFVLENAALYSFWMAEGGYNSSRGYLGAGGAGYLGQRDLADGLRPVDGYRAWTLQYFNPNELSDPASGSDESSDPDGDGYRNIAEYVLGGHPRIAEGPLVQLTPTPGGPVLQFRRRRNTDGVQLTLAVSVDCTSWQPAEDRLDLVPTGSDVEFDYLEVRLPSPLGNTCFFVRLAFGRN